MEKTGLNVVELRENKDGIFEVGAGTFIKQEDFRRKVEITFRKVSYKGKVKILSIIKLEGLGSFLQTRYLTLF